MFPVKNLKPTFLIFALASSVNLCKAEALVADSVNVIGKRENLVGIADTASEGIITHQKISQTPISRAGEILELTPGLVVSQHSGDGKANQYYLRGFNLDHGNDFAVWLDGMPLNMPTHAHGQGYIDSNLLIPELIESMTYKKGPYHAELGDFSSAGAAQLQYYKQLPKSIASISLGQNQYKRLLNAGSGEFGNGTFLYAIETQSYDGPWDKPEDLKKMNGIARFSSGNQLDGFNITIMAYQSKWNATDQIPQRAVRSGLINRFGVIDSTDGGDTQRYSLSAVWHSAMQAANLYMIHYRLNLFSNFTYFLHDPVNGDQFEQADQRNIFGGSAKQGWDSSLFGIDNTQVLGIQSRYDNISNVGLYHTKARQRMATTRQDSVKQNSIGLWWQGGWELTSNLRASTGLRADWYMFDIASNQALNSGDAYSEIFSPKLGLTWRLREDTDLYLNWGSGFHSNDARGATIKIDPTSGMAADKVRPLVKAIGEEIGVRTSWLPYWQSTFTAFQLCIDSELLFIGDAGTTQASRPSRRRGVEWTNHIEIDERSYIDADFAVTQARFRGGDLAGDYIPGAVGQTASLALVNTYAGGWSSATRLRYFGPRALNEDNSVRSNASLIVNGRISYQYSKQLSYALDIFNLFDRKVSDIDYYYTSRLSGEAAAGVDDVHTHPAEPRMLRLTMSINY